MSAPWQGPGPDPLKRAVEAQRRFDIEPGVLGPVAKPRPPERAVPLLQLWWWHAWAWVTWPLAKRQLKKEGWRETADGWMEMP
jgi:hypothetical protein